MTAKMIDRTLTALVLTTVFLGVVWLSASPAVALESESGPDFPVPDTLWQPAAGAVPATGSYVYLDSDPGDWIGRGVEYLYTRADAMLAVTVSGGRLSVSVDGDEGWNGTFQAMSGLTRLVPGYYPDLRRYPFHDPLKGGLSWSGEGRGCNTLTGWFAVDSVTYDGSTLTAIDLRFEQHCEGGAAALHGAIHWEADDLTQPSGPVFPVPEALWRPAPGSIPASGNYVYLDSDPGDWIGAGGEYLYTRANAVLSVSASGGHLSVRVDGDESWTGDLVAMAGLAKLEPGHYPDLQRYPFHNPAKGGLSWRGEGRGSNKLSGWFAIDSVTYDGASLVAIDLRFEQHSEGATPALHGAIHWEVDDPTAPPGPVVPVPDTLWQPAPGSLPRVGNYVYLDSDPGDWVGGGDELLYRPKNASLSVTASGGRLSVSVKGEESWSGTFQAMTGLTRLEPGHYPDLRRYPFHNPVKGGLSWSGEGRGCNTLTGWFAVDSVTYDGSTLTAIDLRFEQHCGGGDPALRGAIHWDMDGDVGDPPTIQAYFGRLGWDSCSGQDFSANRTLDVSVYASDAPGAQLLHFSSPTTDGWGSFWVDLESVDLAPGMVLVVEEVQSGLTKKLILVDLWVDALDPLRETVSGTAPAGSEVWVEMIDAAGEGVRRVTDTAGESGSWSVDLSPADLGWGSWGEVGVTDADGDETLTEALAPTIACDLTGDTIKGSCLSRNRSVTVSVFPGPEASAPLWSGSVRTDHDGRFSAARSTHGADLAGGMFVRVYDGASGITKALTLSPLTFDDLDATTDTARGSGQPGDEIWIDAVDPHGWGEWDVVTPRADGTWMCDFGEWGGDVTLEMTGSATVNDAEFDTTMVTFVPHIDALSSSTHPDPDRWYSSRDPSFSWAPSPGVVSYSWVLDHVPTTVPDQKPEGAATSHAFSGLADGVWYFHVRAFGALDAGSGGYWGATRHIKVQIDDGEPTVTDNTDALWHARAVTVTLRPSDGSGSGVRKTQFRLRGADSWSDAVGNRFDVPAPADGSGDGAHPYEYRALDNAGNVSATGTCTVRIDATRPTPRAYAARVVRGKRASIGYRLRDAAGSHRKGTVTIVIRNARGKVMKRATIRNVPANVKKRWSFTCRFPEGLYTIRVTCVDSAGNRGTRTATARLTVR